MSLILSPLRCPWCNQPVEKKTLKEQDLMQAYLARRAFPCPHCQKDVTLPEKAESLISSGLFIAVILAPLFYYYNWLLIDPRILFGLGVALVITGALFQKLQKVTDQDTTSDE